MTDSKREARIWNVWIDPKRGQIYQAGLPLADANMRSLIDDGWYQKTVIEKSSYDSLLKENQELRGTLDKVNGAYKGWVEEQRSIESLSSEITRLRDALGEIMEADDSYNSRTWDIADKALKE